CLRFEESEKLSIRSLMFGLIESLHLTLTYLIDEKNMAAERSGDQNISCSRALEAAIYESVDVSGESGVLLRRMLNDCGAFVTRFEKE
ncbi:hypothetical protein PMAYCL1PPCAC_13957, partial [Pristionchus mayeri]